MRDMPYILTDACDATCTGIETVLRNEAARREAGQELPEDIRRQLWDAVRERVREMNPVDGDADQNGEGEGEGNENGDGNGNGNGNAEGDGDEHEIGNRNGEGEGNENENEEGENDSRDEQEMYRSLLNQLNEFAQRSREDSGVSIEMESDDHDSENDNHVPFVIHDDNENSEDDNDDDDNDDYDDYDDDDDEIHDDDVVVPGPAAEILFPNGEGIVGGHNPHGFDTIRGDVYRRTGTAASPASRLVERRWLDGVDDKGVPCFMRLQFDEFLLSVHCQLFHSCGPRRAASHVASTTHRRPEFRPFIKRLLSESIKILTRFTAIASRCSHASLRLTRRCVLLQAVRARDQRDLLHLHLHPHHHRREPGARGGLLRAGPFRRHAHAQAHSRVSRLPLLLPGVTMPSYSRLVQHVLPLGLRDGRDRHQADD